jgi:hypothetical protein
MSDFEKDFWMTATTTELSHSKRTWVFVTLCLNMSKAASTASNSLSNAT